MTINRKNLRDILYLDEYRENIRYAIDHMGGFSYDSTKGALTRIQVGGRTILLDGPHWIQLPEELQSKMNKVDRDIVMSLEEGFTKKLSIIYSALKIKETK